MDPIWEHYCGCSVFMNHRITIAGECPVKEFASTRSAMPTRSLVAVALTLGVIGFGWAAPAFAQYQPAGMDNRGYSSQSLPPLQGRVVTAPAGTFVTASLNSPVSSEYARVGDRFQATLANDLSMGGNLVLPGGSRLEGQVVSVTKAGRMGKNGELDIRFTSATLPNGQSVPLSARIQTEDNTGIIKGGTTAGRVGRAAVRTGVGAGLGAALGTAMGPLSGGEVGRGAVYGTAVGAGMGALAAGWQKGKEALVPAGQPLNIMLDQPLTVAPQMDSYPQNNYQYGAPQNQPYNNGGYNNYNNYNNQPNNYGY
jgi:hypothetical protein